MFKLTIEVRNLGDLMTLGAHLMELDFLDEESVSTSQPPAPTPSPQPEPEPFDHEPPGAVQPTHTTAPQPEPPPTNGDGPVPHTEKQHNFVLKLAREQGWNEAEFKSYVVELQQTDSFEAVTKAEMSTIIDALLNNNFGDAPPPEMQA